MFLVANVKGLLDRAHMSEARGISTPMISGCKLTKYEGNYVQDLSLQIYRWSSPICNNH